MHTNPRRGLARRFAAGLLAAALGLGAASPRPPPPST